MNTCVISSISLCTAWKLRAFCISILYKHSVLCKPLNVLIVHPGPRDLYDWIHRLTNVINQLIMYNEFNVLYMCECVCVYLCVCVYVSVLTRIFIFGGATHAFK